MYNAKCKFDNSINELKNEKITSIYTEYTHAHSQFNTQCLTSFNLREKKQS